MTIGTVARGGGGLQQTVNKASAKVSINFKCSFLLLMYLLLVIDRDLLKDSLAWH